MLQMIGRWQQLSPCDGSQPMAKLLLYHPGNESSIDISRVHALLGARGHACFGLGVEIAFARLPPEVAYKHPDGTCGQFYSLFSVLRGRADYFYLMEPDALAVRAHWLDPLVEEGQHTPCTSFWIRGSVSHCNAQYGELQRKHDLHINGGALYCVDDAGLRELLRKVQAFWPPYSEKDVEYPGCGLGGFDHSIYEFLHHPSNFDYTRSVLSKYQYTELMYNLCEDEYVAADVLERAPNAHIIHSKARPPDFIMRDEHCEQGSMGSIYRICWDPPRVIQFGIQ